MTAADDTRRATAVSQALAREAAAVGITPPPNTPVQVLLIWSDKTEALKDGLNHVLSDLTEAGVIVDAHPDGGSQGWEWRFA